ncbi:PGRS family protein [Sorangium sp. So ce1151]|uniref:PGRS family protein n=1 Tax=Sorangium sp. So ce1151 TaxID=3133332 RepID=UPI003F614049
MVSTGSEDEMTRQRRWWMRGVLGLLFISSGCDGWWINLTDDCQFTLTCEHHDWLKQDGGTPSDCIPRENAGAVDDGCGVFVSGSGADRNPGTKGLPLKTLREALQRAGGSGKQRVYLCAGTFEERVEVTEGVTIYGGLDCASGWGWVGERRKTVLTTRVGEIPLVVRGDGGEGKVRLEDVHVKARGIGRDEQVVFAGVSSIAALAEEANVELARCVLEAGDAAAGEAGAAYSVSAPRSIDGKRGGQACSAEIVVTGGVKNDCGTPDDPSDDSRGGSGGQGEADSGGPGAPGTPEILMNGGKGEGADVCAAGTAGKDGGEGGPGAGATGLGEISARGFSGAAGREGAKGGTAQGGGGGGGSKGGAGEGKCMSEALAGGASGGSGGAGGCGGAGGRGGSAGGASIALISLNARLSFDEVTLKTGRGGAGGKGGAGQEGGEGGAGGPGGETPVSAVDLHEGCAGGPGGKGGPGGSGGGGLGGHAIGIAYKGAAPPVQGGTIELGEAGPGGAGADAEGEGAAGVKAEVQAF